MVTISASSGSATVSSISSSSLFSVCVSVCTSICVSLCAEMPPTSAADTAEAPVCKSVVQHRAKAIAPAIHLFFQFFSKCTFSFHDRFFPCSFLLVRLLSASLSPFFRLFQPDKKETEKIPVSLLSDQTFMQSSSFLFPLFEGSSHPRLCSVPSRYRMHRYPK